MASVFARFRLGALGALAALTVLGAVPAAHAAVEPVCGPVLVGFMHCNSLSAHAPKHAASSATATPSGYGPSDLQSAYSLADKVGLGGDQTVAIVDAYDDPTAESDLAAYRSQYGLPPCTTDNGCFRKVDQRGGTSYPAHDPNWSSEISLDLDMVSAVCPHCNILLVEADDDSGTSLYAAVNRAAALGATQISNSWGGNEYGSERYDETNFNHPGISITVSSGDYGYGVEYPAASAYVTAVGGTSLARASNARGWSESAWSGSGSGCSAVISKPAWQHDAGCSHRTVADVSAVADPHTGVAVYSTDDGGWSEFGGTSAAAPIVAAAYALMGSTASDPGFAYANPTSFNDVAGGSNGACGSYLCNAVAGFDGPTGMGTPNLAQTGGPASPAPSGSGTTTTNPPPPAATPPPPAPVPAPAPVQPLLSSIAVAGAGITASRSGRLRVRLTCAAGRPRCAGRLKLQLARSHGRVVTLGSRAYSIAPGHRAYISVRLSRYGLSQLRKHRRLRIYATALDSDGTAAQSSFRARAPKPKRHRRRH